MKGLKMAAWGNTKYSVWNSVRQALARNKIAKSGNTATILLETFLEVNGKLRAAEVYKRGLCPEGKFYAWRKELCDKGWLVFELINNGKVARYYPGKKLVNYVNKEKELSYELASTKDLYEAERLAEARYVSKEKHERLEERVKSLEAAMDRVINILDPDTNEAKRQKYISGGYDRVLKPLPADSDIIPL